MGVARSGLREGVVSCPYKVKGVSGQCQREGKTGGGCDFLLANPSYVDVIGGLLCMGRLFELKKLG